MCGGKKEDKKIEDAPPPEAPPEAPPEEPAPPPEEPKAASTAGGKSTLSKMSDSKLAAGQQSLNLMTTRVKGANLAKGPPGANKSVSTMNQAPSLALTTTRADIPKGGRSQTMKVGKVAAK